MKENIFDVLIYLFENYLGAELNSLPDSEDIKIELMEAGFEQNEVNNAFDWLEALTEQDYITPSISTAFRIFTAQEQIKLNLECRDFLLFLQHNGILTSTTREIVIDRAMAIEHDKITLDELKWTVLLVLLSQSDDDAAYAKMEDIVYEITPPLLH
jgi:Smg protein